MWRVVRVGSGATLLGLLFWIGWLVVRSTSSEPSAPLPATAPARDPQVLAFFEVDAERLDVLPLAVVFESGRFVRWAGDSATVRRYQEGALELDELARILDGIDACIPPTRRTSSVANRSKHEAAVIGGPGASFVVASSASRPDERWSCLAPALETILSLPAVPSEAPEVQVAPILPEPHD
ncbi:MAG TPA: hypothetical protein VF530_09420 [Planctomycetota bacterium]